MKIFSKEKLDDGRRNVYLLGLKIFSYKRQIEKIDSTIHEVTHV